MQIQGYSHLGVRVGAAYGKDTEKLSNAACESKGPRL